MLRVLAPVLWSVAPAIARVAGSLPPPTDPDTPAEFARIRLFTDGASQVMGYDETPKGARRWCAQG